MMKIYLLNREEKLVQVLNESDFATDPVYKEEINGADTLEFELISDVEIEKGFHVLFFDEDEENWREYTVISPVETRSSTGFTRNIYCESIFYELIGDWIDDRRLRESTARQSLSVALETTRWTVGKVDDLGHRTVSFYRIDAKTAVEKVANTFQAEIKTRIEVVGNEITGRFVDLYKRRGVNRGKRFTYTKDLEEINREVSEDPVITALHGFGKGEEVGDGYGRRITFADINDGKTYLENEQARLTFGRNDENGNKAHVFGSVKFDDIEDVEELKQETAKVLDEVSTPEVTYTLNVHDLSAFGLDYEKARLGDVVTVIDKTFHPEIRIKARVVARERYLFNRVENKLTIGNIRETYSAAASNNQKTLEEVRDKLGVYDGIAEGTIQIPNADGSASIWSGEDEPVHPHEGDIWFKPEGEETKMYERIDGEWVLVIFGRDYVENMVEPLKEQVESTEKKANEAAKEIANAIQGSGSVSLKDLIAQKISGEEASSLFFQNADKIGLTYLDENGEPQAMIGIVDGKIFINGVQAMLKGDDVIIDGSLTVTEDMFAPGITFDWAKGKTFDASEIRVINLDFSSMSGGDIELSKGFRITNNGEVVMSVDRNGKLIFNVPGLLTKDDIDKIPTIKGDKGDPGRPGEKGEKGDPGEDGKDGRPGQDGKTSYLHIAYANKNKDGEITDFSTDDPEREYVGLYRSFSSYQSTDPSDYKWSKFNNNEDIDKLIEQLDSKADMDAVTEIDEKLSDLETSSATQAQVGEIEQALRSYEKTLKSQQADAENAQADLQQLLGRFATIDAQLGEYTAKMKFIDTTMTFGEEGLFIGDPATKTGIQYGKNRIDIMDNGEPVAQITQQMLKINRGIFVESLTIGEYMVAMADKGFLTINWLGGKD